MTVRGRRRWPVLPVAVSLVLVLAGCSTTVSGTPAPHALPTPVVTTTSLPPTTPITTTASPTTTPPATHKPEQRPKPQTHPTVVVPTKAPTKHTTPPAPQKMVTYLITGTGTVSVRYLAGGAMHSASGISLPWRKTVPLSNGQYELDITTGADADVDEQVSVEGAVVGTGHNTGAGTGSFSGSY